MKNSVKFALVMIFVLVVALGGCKASKYKPAPSPADDYTAAQHIAVGDRLLEDGSVEAAYSHYVKAEALDPDNLEVQMKKAFVFRKRGAYVEALGIYESVLAKEPAHAGAHYGAGKCLYHTGVTGEAKRHFAQATVADPELWEASHYLGIIASEEGKNEEAEAAFRRVLSARSGSADAYNSLGVALMMAGKDEDAVRVMRQGMQYGAPERLANNLGMALCRLERYDEALMAFASAADEATAYNNLGWCLYLDGKYALAVERFEKALELSPTFYVRAYENLQKAKLALRYSN